MTSDIREAMGLNGRKKMEKEFDRKIVINAYKNRLTESEINRKFNICKTSGNSEGIGNFFLFL